MLSEDRGCKHRGDRLPPIPRSSSYTDASPRRARFSCDQAAAPQEPSSVTPSISSLLLLLSDSGDAQRRRAGMQQQCGTRAQHPLGWKQQQHSLCNPRKHRTGCKNWINHLSFKSKFSPNCYSACNIGRGGLYFWDPLPSPQEGPGHLWEVCEY